MKTKNIRYLTLKILFILFVFIPFFVNAKEALAAGPASIDFSPSTGAYQVGKTFSVAVELKGNGDTFNAAQATVVIPSPLQVSDLVLGNCGFSFLTTPTTSDPSFAGVTLGGSISQCTVYTLTLSSATAGTFGTSLENVSIKQTHTADEIFGTAENGSYTISTSANALTTINSIFAQHPAPTPAQTQANQTNTNSQTGYSLNINVLSTGNQPLSGVSVSIDSSNIQQTTNQTGSVDFSNLSPGVHVVTATLNGKQIGKEIINVKGPNHVMVLGMQEQNQSNVQPVWIYVAVFLVIVILVVVYLLYKRSLRSTNNAQ